VLRSGFDPDVRYPSGAGEPIRDDVGVLVPSQPIDRLEPFFSNFTGWEPDHSHRSHPETEIV